MGMFFDNVGITNQASSAAAGRLDYAQDFRAGGAGPRGSVTQNFVFGRENRQETSGQLATTGETRWVWVVIGLAALYLTALVFKRKRD